MNVIAEHPPKEMYATGLEIDCQCARCGGSCEWVDCWNGCEDGYLNRYEEDPLWYDDEYEWPCDVCRARGGWNVCGNSAEFCKANPLHGRENIERGQIEWFTIQVPMSLCKDCCAPFESNLISAGRCEACQAVHNRLR